MNESTQAEFQYAYSAHRVLCLNMDDSYVHTYKIVTSHNIVLGFS